jgi:NADH-quinone oxidoreductase subunit C
VSAEWAKDLPVMSRSKMSPERTGMVESVFIQPQDLIDAVKRVYDAGYFIEDLSVVDTSDGFMVAYHFDHYTSPGRISLRVLVSHDAPEVPSISGIFSGADWHERECHDFFGVVFTGHPNLVPLLLPEDADFHPLLKKAEEKKRLADLMTPGEVEVSTPAFEALFPKPAEGGEPEKPVDQEKADKETGSPSGEA